MPSLTVVLPPISTVGVTSSSEDINALVTKTRDLMLEAIEDLGRKRAELNRRDGKFSTSPEREPLVAQTQNTPSLAR